MKCDDVRKKLSLYIDGMLGDEMKAVLENHIGSCSACSEALEGLKMAKERLKGLGEVGVPDDFLARVHERIEQESLFKRLVQKLFSPVGRKIPLELAAAVSVVAVVIFLFQVMPLLKTELRVRYAEPLFESVEKAEAPKEQLDVPKPRDSEVLSEVLKKGVEPARTIEPKVPTQEPEIPSEAYQTGEIEPEKVEHELAAGEPFDAEGKLGEIDLVLLITPEVEGITKTRDEAYVKEPAVQLRSKKLTMQEHPEEKQESHAERAAPDPDQVIHSVYSQVIEFVRAAEGRVVSSEKDLVTELPVSITVQVPTSNFGQFLINLGHLGHYESSVSPEAMQDKNSVQLTITFTLSY